MRWGPYGIRVNAICPGFFPSKLASGLLEVIGPSGIASTPLGRLGGDTDLQGAAVYLASDASRHVTGQYIGVDGGGALALRRVGPRAPKASDPNHRARGGKGNG